VKHDSIPDFSELRYELSKVQQRLIAAFNKYLTGRNQQHLQRAQKDVTQAQRVEESQKKREGYAQARQQFSRLKNKDSEVRALLMEYRNRLLSKLKSDPVQKSLQVDDVRVAEMETVIKLTPDQYAGVSIELRYN
jgi:exonuclease VII large subunit